MRISLKQLKHLSVETISGVKLGHIYDVVLETEGQMIAQYEVRPSMLSSKEYLISRDQIVRFEDKKIIVENNAAQEKTAKQAKNQVNVSPEPVAMREIT